MAEWFVKSKTLFASSSECNAIIASALLSGVALNGIKTTCRCDRCPDCCCGQDSIISSMNLSSFWTVMTSSSNIFQSSADANGIINLISVITPMDTYQRKVHLMNNSTMSMLCNPFTMYSS